MARLPKVKLRAIPVFPSNVTGGNAIDVTKANGSYSINLNVSNIHVGAVATVDAPTTYAISWGQVTTDNPAGSFQLVPYAGLQPAITPGALSRTNDTNVTLTLGGAPATALLQATSITLGWTGALAASRGGFGSDVSAAAGVPLFAAGVPTFTGTTGNGNFALATSPTFVTPVLGTPASGSLANCTGYSASQLAGTPGAINTFLGTPTSANLRAALSDESGTGFAYFQGGDIGTPSAGVATNLSGTAASLTVGNATLAATVTTNANLTGAITSVGNAASLGSFTSAQLAAALTNETGTGAAVFATSPALVTPTGIVKGDVGLGNVDNTSDANKPVSSAQQTALNLKVATVKKQAFTASGTYTPSTGMLYAILECVGGGGGGGGAAGSASATFSGGGGGSGGYSRAIVSAASVGASKAVTIGPGGAGGAAGSNNGVAGTDTSVGALCVGKGGSGGLFGSAGQVGAGGLGGVAGTGDLTPLGNPGGFGIYVSGVTGTLLLATNFGASSALGAGAPAPVPSGGATVIGNAASANTGGGGSGGITPSTSSIAGGNGGSGIVFITEFCSQ